MGIIQSQADENDKQCSASATRTDENVEDSSVDEWVFDQPITEDLLIGCLSFVPEKDLVLNCRLVCKQWKYIIDSQSVWRLKCERENVKLPTRKFTKLPKHHYRYVYWHSMCKAKNLVKNPCGENKLDGWTIVNRNHHFYNNSSFLVENPPAGADAVPEQVGSQCCFATTYTACEKYQTINFNDPIDRYLLKHDLVQIKVGEWYAARFDCASEYKLKVCLYDEDQMLIDKFQFEYNEEQWTGREWHLITHVFDNATEASYLTFTHYGKDRQFWAGHYGSKMTGAFVELCIK